MKKILLAFNLLILLSLNHFSTKAQNPLSIANEFNILTEGNLTISQGDIEGAIGVGGDLIVLGNSQRTSSNKTGGVSYVTIAGTKYALIVGGDLSGTVGGNIFKVDGKAGSTSDHYIRFKTLVGETVNADGGGIDIGNPPTNPASRFIRVNSTDQLASTVVNAATLFDFTAAFTVLKQKSISLTNCPANVNFVNSGGQAMLTLGNNPTNVWNVSGTDLNNFSQINLSGTLPNANNPLIINVNAAGTFNWQNKKIVISGEGDDFVEINRAPYILFNFYNTTTLNIQSSNLLTASILAPLADITNNGSGNITGQIIGKSFTKPNAGELHIARFNANVSCACPVITVNAGADGEVCAQVSNEGLNNNSEGLTTVKKYQLAGQATGTTSVLWNDNGAGGSFDDPTKLNAIYTPPVGGTILTLTLSSTDPYQCAPVTDNMTLTEIACAGILDPCTCNEVTYNPTEVMEVKDFIEIDGTSGQTWTIVANGGGTNPLNGGAPYGTMQQLDPLGQTTTNIDFPTGTIIPEVSPGIYRLDFAHDSGKGYTFTVTNGTQTLSISNYCVITTFTPNFSIGATICTNASPINLAETITDGTPADSPGTVDYYYINNLGLEVPITSAFNPADYPVGAVVQIFGKYTPNNVIDCEIIKQATNQITITNCALPLDLLSFTGKTNNDAIVLNWKTSNERDFSHYEVQKSSDALEYGSIGSVKSNKGNYYNFIDNSPNPQNNYYRLKLVNNDGSFNFSQTINVNFEKNKGFVNVENPSKNGEFVISTGLKNPSFTVLNSAGTKIEANTISNGVNKYVVKPNHVAAGLYFLNIISEGKIITKKVIIP